MKSAAILVCLCVALAAAFPAAATAVTVDGVITAGDGYSIMRSLIFAVEGKKKDDPDIPGTGAKLYLYQDGDSLFVGLSLPKTLVDNSYGANAIGWGSVDHPFEKLVDSDQAEFVFSDVNGTTLLEVTVDYLKDGSKDKGPPYDAPVKVGKNDNPAHVLAAATSLLYDWETFGGDYPDFFGKGKDSPAADSNYVTDDPALAGWVYDVTYEFQIDLDAFAGATVDLTGGNFIEIIHASPNKIGGNKVYDFVVTDDQPAQEPVVPEPLTMAGLLLGVGALVGYVRRRG